MSEQVDHILVARQLSFGFNKPLTDPFDLKIGRGKLIALTGRNGSGKSTFIRTLLGLIPSLSGELRLSGKLLASLDPQSRAQLCSAVFTGNANIPALKVQTLVEMGRHPYLTRMGKLSEGDRRHVTEALEMLGLATFIDRYVGELSDGERQRVMLARVLAQDTPLVFMDEPLAFLDFESKKEILGIFRKLVDDTGKTIIYSTHELHMVPLYSDEILVINKGEVLHTHGEEANLKEALALHFGLE
jgi:iron complex transport system ATP-binding protein